MLRREDGRLWMCSPPLRPQADQDAMWMLVSNRTIDLISSDHCPFNQTQKALGVNDFRKAPNGVPGVETRLSLIHHFGVRPGRIDLQDWVRLCCARPAEMHTLPAKGRIAPGADADVVVFDPGLSKSLSAGELHSALDWSAYDGITVDGWPRDVVSRGDVIVRDGRFVGQPGRGRFIRRSP
jgi:dihydropyrimidinase